VGVSIGNKSALRYGKSFGLALNLQRLNLLRVLRILLSVLRVLQANTIV
jgi:hypothetical protein